MDERPGKWLAHADPEEERRLVFQFANYGISRGLLSPETIELLEANFDRFAPIMVTAQRPPHFPQKSLQRWYRERADRAQADAMMEALRPWLSARFTEAPMNGGMQTLGHVEQAILETRLAAAELLGDWGDRRALPGLRALQAGLSESSPVIVAAIRRIEDPEHADIVVVEPGGRLMQLRPRRELDSMTVRWNDVVTDQRGTWTVDRRGIARVWRLLGRGSAPGWGKASHAEPVGSFGADRLKLYFRDGRILTLEGSGNGWVCQDNGRLWEEVLLDIPGLEATLVDELDRIGIAPDTPRFIQESVTLFIDPGMLRVTGIYGFEGVPDQGWFPLRYPIARGEGLGTPRIEAVALRTGTERRELPVHWEPDGDDYRIALETKGAREYELEVRYSQPVTERSAAYLVTTAREWGRPLHRGWFQVVMDSSLGVPRFELPFREVGERPGFRRYLYEAAPFRPERDLVVRW